MSPMPGVTLVRTTNAHEAGKRKPMTIAAASMIWMLPALISAATGSVKSTKIVNGPAIHTSSAEQDRPPDRHEHLERQPPPPADDELERRRVVVAVVLSELGVRVEVRRIRFPVVPDVDRQTARRGEIPPVDDRGDDPEQDQSVTDDPAPRHVAERHRVALATGAPACGLGTPNGEFHGEWTEQSRREHGRVDGRGHHADQRQRRRQGDRGRPPLPSFEQPGDRQQQHDRVVVPQERRQQLARDDRRQVADLGRRDADRDEDDGDHRRPSRRPGGRLRQPRTSRPGRRPRRA